MDPLNDNQKKTEALQSVINTLEQQQNMTKSQEKIIQAAAKLFAEKGYDSSSTSDIAKKAGVAEVTLFRNFKSKKNLLYHILAPMFIQLTSKDYIQTVQNIFKQGIDQDPKLVLNHAFKDRLEHMEKNKELLNILFRESYIKPEIKTAIREHITNPVIDTTKEFIIDKKEREEFKKFDEHVVANLFLYLLFGYVFIHQILGDEELTDQPNELEEIVEIILNGLTA